MADGRSRSLVVRLLTIAGGSLALLLLCGGGSIGLIHYLKRPPSELRERVEPRLDEIRGFADAVASRCGEVRNGGLAAQIAGTVPASPAAGTPLAHDQDVLQVQVGCYWFDGSPQAGDYSALGNDFLPLYDRPRPAARSSDGQWEISEGWLLDEPDPTREEEAIWPSFEVDESQSLDVKVRRPLPDGTGYVQVIVSLRKP